MELLVNFVDQELNKNWGKGVSNIPKEGIVSDYKFIDNRFHCFKVLKEQDAKKYAVKRENVLEALDKIVGDKINYLGLLVFDIHKKRIYFNSKKSQMKEMMWKYFEVKSDQIVTEVSFEELASLDSLRVIEYRGETLSIFEQGLQLPENIDVLTRDNTIERVSVDLKFKAKPTNKFIFKKIEDLIDTYSTGSKRLILSGYDKKNNPVKSDETGTFNKKIDIDLSASDYNQVKGCSFEDIVSQIKEKTND